MIIKQDCEHLQGYFCYLKKTMLLLKPDCENCKEYSKHKAEKKVEDKKLL